MTTYIEYGVKLTDGQKSKLASAIINQSPLTLRLKHSHLRGSDELMLTKRQIDKIKKSIANGTGSDIKISKTQIRKSVKHGGNLFSSLASIGARVLPYAVKGIAKVAPAIATGAATALGEIGLNKIFGSGGHLPLQGISIPPEFFPMLPPIVREFTKSQINQINKAYQSGSGVVIKPTRKQIEGGFLGTLASIGIPIAISLVSKMLGGGLQVDRRASSNTANVYVPPTHGEGYPYRSPPFIGTWENPIGMGVKKKKPEGRPTPFCSGGTSLNHSKLHFVIKPLSNFDLMEWVKRFGIKHFRGIYSRDGLPKKIRKECGIINLDDISGPGTHWVCYRNLDSVVEYFDPFGLIMPNEALEYFHTGSVKPIVYSMDEIQNRSTVLCGNWCLYYLFERQKGKGILDVIHSPNFDNDNSDFIKSYFGG
ncbi:unnamed protein product [Porites lobata]|uniref:Uncharacterized protein n=1 Tax=Porites lobata TaxID=104759 RepID=A0ABN8PB98_9CNID|nr:unnamed protein product [Porites lobata]